MKFFRISGCVLFVGAVITEFLDEVNYLHLIFVFVFFCWLELQEITDAVKKKINIQVGDIIVQHTGKTHLHIHQETIDEAIKTQQL